MNLVDGFKEFLKYVTIKPDIERKREIEEYGRTALSTLAEKSHPDYGFVLNTLKGKNPISSDLDYRSFGPFSFYAKMKLIDGIKKLKESQLIN